MEVRKINIDILSDYNNLHKMYYTVEDVPPFHLALLFGIQVYDLYYFVTYTSFLNDINSNYTQTRY